jgi:predicted alpha/beta-hydrolase family hydrolase
MTKKHPDTKLLFDGPSDAGTTIALAHGAGAPMDSPFMEFFAKRLGERGFRVARFEFPYMAARRVGAKRGPPDREPVLRQTWLSIVDRLGRERVVIGGKSMGGRIASLIADEARVSGLVCLGYPFQPGGKEDRRRIEHLETIQTPTLIVQGERDSFGGREVVSGYRLSPAVRVDWAVDGDHSFKPRKSSGRTEEQNWQAALDHITAFVGKLTT